MELVDKAPRTPTLVQVAFDILKNAILEARLQSGKIYKEAAIAREMGVSKTPVHEALTILAERGFVEILPRRGFRVHSLSPADVVALFELRRPLEEAVLHKITPNLTDNQAARLDNLIEELKTVGNGLAYQQADRNIHRRMAAFTENKYLIAALNGIWDLCDWMGMHSFGLDRDLDFWIQHHVSLNEWIKRRDVDRAWKVLEMHLAQAEERAITSLTRPV